ncbi:MAG: CFI-box-CTERM domain-containing protein, partial [Intestinibacter sp.]|uniref:CFI-box-CTERM domain-containing protein n=1 Tax=Intestinibacter sp. TaxID=1965304 RepID=UPI002A812E4B
HFPDFLRTMGNENFAVATLMFMIMLPGKPPYSQQGGEDPVSNIIKMDFSYPFGESSNKKTPEGPWRYIWSHLTYDLKEAFYHTFRKEGKYSLEEKRLSANEWLVKFKIFLELLDSGKYIQQDSMSEELFPTRLKKNPNAVYIKCKLCNQEVDKSQSKEGICKQCLNKGEVYNCKKCGKELLYTNYQKYVKKSKRHTICQECFDYGNTVKIRQNCIDCGRVFELTNNECDFYEEKGYDIPKRCKSCRESKKTSSHSGNTGNSGSSCFITTAVCEYYGKDDNCEELTILREYRDYWLINQADGEELIREYYNCAPSIVSLLKKSDSYAKYCEELMGKYIKPCVELIKCNKYLECKNLYIDMVMYAKSITR